ncbi:hypothetical protein MY1884_007775 [Beauveria asiatica]
MRRYRSSANAPGECHSHSSLEPRRVPKPAFDNILNMIMPRKKGTTASRFEHSAWPKKNDTKSRGVPKPDVADFLNMTMPRKNGTACSLWA